MCVHERFKYKLGTTVRLGLMPWTYLERRLFLEDYRNLVQIAGEKQVRRYGNDNSLPYLYSGRLLRHE